MNTHSLRRTSPRGGPFLGKCVYCGKESLPLGAVNEDCPTAPDQARQILDILEEWPTAFARNTEAK